MENGEWIPHLFRTEYRKIIAVLCKQFGFEQVSMAEDIVSETFLTAMQVWGVEGVPPQPTAWLYRVAKNKAINYLKRTALFKDKVTGVLQQQQASTYEEDASLLLEDIRDSELQMMFAVCHPSINAEAQMGLCLRILCGFGIQEIADAFLTNKETIYKRLTRAKEKLKEEQIQLQLPEPGEIKNRLDTVLRTIYLLFNEGYHSNSHASTIRRELCIEAMRLCSNLVEYPPTNTPPVNALMALMCFHSSRMDARMNAHQDLVLYDEQDSSLWNTDLISRGVQFLKQAATGHALSVYHLEAGIAYWHTQKMDTPEKWESILHYYNQLLQLSYSPIAALNRTYALSRARGKEAAIVAAETLDLPGNPYYALLLADLYTGIDAGKARQHYDEAMTLVKTESERKVIRKKMDTL